MRLQYLTECSARDSVIAEIISNPQTALRALLLLEYEALVSQFKYTKAKNDPNPRIVALGRWHHPRTNNDLVAGINLNYLDKEQIDALGKALPEAMAQDSLKAKYWHLRSVLPDIMSSAYRTYDQKYIESPSTKTVEIGEPAKPSKQQKDIAPLPKPEPKDVPERPAGKEQAPREKEPEIKPRPEVPKPTPTPEIPKAPETKTEKPEIEPETPKPEAKPEPKPETPKPEKKGIIKKIGGLIGKLAGLVKNKLTRNKAKKAEEIVGPKPPTPPTIDREREVYRLDKIEKEHEREEQRPETPEPKAPADEVKKIEEIEKEHEKPETPETPKDEIDKLKDIEDDNQMESFDRKVNIILEEYVVPLTNAEYVMLHSPDKFFEYSGLVGSTILESTTGTKFLAVYNIVEDKLIIDLADSHSEMLRKANWDVADTIRFVAEDGAVEAIYNNPALEVIAEGIIKSDIGKLLAVVD